MARRLNEFPSGDGPGAPRRYPWDQWTDGGVWEIRQGEDYDVDTENMRVNLHMRADAHAVKVRTTKISDDSGQRLVFQFFDPEAQETEDKMATITPETAQEAIELLYADAMNIYERARHEVTIPRSDGTRQKYAATRYRKQIEDGYAKGELVPAIARIVRRPTLGFGHLENAGRPDLMVETLVLNTTKPYHHLFSQKTIDVARARMSEHGYLDD
jgi:hypothetical protein